MKALLTVSFLIVSSVSQVSLTLHCSNSSLTTLPCLSLIWMLASSSRGFRRIQCRLRCNADLDGGPSLAFWTSSASVLVGRGDDGARSPSLAFSGLCFDLVIIQFRVAGAVFAVLLVLLLGLLLLSSSAKELPCLSTEWIC